MPTIIIDPELQQLLPAVPAEQITQLEAKLLAEGCQESFVVWAETNILLDGHHRYRLCQKHGLSYNTRSVSLADMDAAKLWMIEHQDTRRNWTPEQRSYYRGMQYTLRKKQGSRTDLTSHQKDEKSDTATRLAAEHHVGKATIERDAKFAKAVDTVATVIGKEARQALLNGTAKVTRAEVQQLATIAKANPQTARHVLQAVQDAPTPKAAGAVVREAARQQPPPLVLEVQEPKEKRGIETLHADNGREMFIVHNPDSKPVFNRTNDMVDWASWTWNPVTGCWHDCTYCYAREIAHNERMRDAYPKQFEPTFHPARLAAPANTPCPKVIERPADRNVFVCSMADLFGKWVPTVWIDQVFARVIAHQEWNFLFLTKFPQRLREVCDGLGGFPPNAWVGCTVDGQARVATAERAFDGLQATVKWLSVEPLNERLTFRRLEFFDWLVIGGQSASYFNNTPAQQPEWEWVEHLWKQARAAGLKIYWKPNLTVRPQEMPWEAGHTI